MEERIYGLAPIANEESRILILGSMPGEQSLNIQQYYGHRRNHFWKILQELFNEEIEDNYESKVNFLLRNKIALWDVIGSCKRQGSLDADITDEVANDLTSFFEKYPKIKFVAFNGDKAYKTFKKHIGFKSYEHIEFVKLTSTSPANVNRFEEKVENWRIIRSKL